MMSPRLCAALFLRLCAQVTVLIRAGVDCIDVSKGDFESCDRLIEPLYYPRGYHVYLAEMVKKRIAELGANVPVIAVGRLTDPALCRRLVEDGKTDLVALGRQALPAPDFAQNGYYYVFYTRGAAGSQNHNGVSRFTASGNGTVSGSEIRLWEDNEVAGVEHHGGSLAFGADGKLYITYGDQFSDSSVAQNLSSFRGR